MPWLLLFGAIVCEVFATVNMRLADGFTKLVPSIFVVVGYLVSFWLFSMVLTRGIALGVAYGVWAACGLALVALIGAAFLGDSLTWVQLAGIGALIVGVLALEMGGAH